MSAVRNRMLEGISVVNMSTGRRRVLRLLLQELLEIVDIAIQSVPEVVTAKSTLSKAFQQICIQKAVYPTQDAVHKAGMR